MTNLQLLLAIFIPTLAIALAWFNESHRFGGMEQRLQSMDQRLDRMDQRLDRMDQRSDRLEANIRDFRHEVITRFDSIDVELRYFHGETGKLTGRIDEVSKRIS